MKPERGARFARGREQKGLCDRLKDDGMGLHEEMSNSDDR
jgi:hypothetical protein